MILQLDSKTRIKGTERAWELQRTRTRKGELIWEPYKWFKTFGSALDEAVHREIRIHPAVGLADAIEAVSGIVQRYTELIPSDYRLSK